MQVSDLITPLIAAIWGGSFFGDLYFTINYSKFLYGDFLNQVTAPHTLSSPLLALTYFSATSLDRQSTKKLPSAVKQDRCDRVLWQACLHGQHASRLSTCDASKTHGDCD